MASSSFSKGDCKRSGLWRLLLCPSWVWLHRFTVITAVISLSFVLAIPYYAQPQLAVGTIADRDIVSPVSAVVGDMKATQLLKEKARQQVEPVFFRNPVVEQNLQTKLDQIFQWGDALRRLPFTDRLSWQDQLVLLRLSDAQWQALNGDPSRLPPQLRSTLNGLENSMGAVAYAELWQKINARRQAYQSAIHSPIAPWLDRGQILSLTDRQWQQLQTNSQNTFNDLLQGGIPAGLPKEMLIHRLLSSRFAPETEPERQLFVQILTQVVQPNLQFDLVETNRRAEQAAALVQEQTMEIKVGQVIVQGGQMISEAEFAILDQLNLAERQPNWGSIAVIFTAVSLSIALIVSLCHVQLFKLRNGDGLAIFVTVLAIALCAVFMLPSLSPLFPLASVGLILGSFYCRRLATLVTLLLGGLVALSTAPGVVNYVPIMAGAIIAGVFTDRPRARSRIAMIGVVVAVVQGLVYGMMALFVGSTPTMLVLAVSLQFAAGGLISAILALGAIPYLEQISYALTPFRLAELADLDRPLLRLLVTEAPGTFQHTLFVANLAEAAARALKADTALVRTGTLYHDIGKTLKPDHFIENQMGQENPHNKLNDPWESARIIKAHVSEGLKLAKKYRLPKQLQAFIPEHQGTIVISYFYHQAKQQFPDLSCDDFRYDGPIPQSRETGIVMLADACEAALRSLGQDVDVATAKEMVWRIFQSRWQDGQLADSGLTLKELDTIADVFLQVWQQRNHGRIKYPNFAVKVDPSGASLPAKDEQPVGHA
jgi:putative nucleotidyltransferase with HDIG domain